MNDMSDSATFWETHYTGLDPRWGTRPNPALTDLVNNLAATPGTALDLGCGHGGDALWLAARGWNVTATDISTTALKRVASHAATAGLTARVHTSQHDLTETFPDGSFDLINACYFHTPTDIPREQVLQRAARSITPGGLLLIVDHASIAPWSWQAGQDIQFPTPSEVLASLQLPDHWHTEYCEAPSRTATGPRRETATVTDNVIAIRRTP